jgi:hypothetical protein
MLDGVDVKTSFGEITSLDMNAWLIKQLLEQGWEPLGQFQVGFQTELVKREY